MAANNSWFPLYIKDKKTVDLNIEVKILQNNIIKEDSLNIDNPSD